MIKILKRIDKPLFFVTIFMFIFGLIMIFSASYVETINSMGNAYYYLIRHGIILLVCLFVFLVLIKFPLKTYKHLYKLIIFGSIALLVLVYMFGNVVNGSRSWFALPYFNLQPSELAKIGIIVFMAVYYDKIKDKNNSYKTALFPFIYIAAIFGLIVAQPDLGSALIVLFISILIFFSVPLLPEVRKQVNKVMLITIALISFLGFIFVLSGKIGLYEYQLQRFNFLKPCARYTEVGTGYQVCNSFIAINNGGIFGVGIGKSTQKYLY